jgi:hypothetical protein
MSAVDKSMLELKFQLHCHRVAAVLLAQDLLFFADDDADGKVHPMVWCGGAFLPDMVEDGDCWEQANWSDIPLLFKLYQNFGEIGLFVWCVRKRRASRDILTNAVRRAYGQVSEMICQHRAEPNALYESIITSKNRGCVH